MWFSCFCVLPGSAEAQVICGGIVKCLFVAYFISNVSAKKYQNPFMWVKVIASRRWDVFLRHGVYYLFMCPRGPLLKKMPHEDCTREDNSGKNAALCCSFVPSDLDLWPWHSNLGEFGTTHLTAKFHHPTFNRSEVIVLTNKQTDAIENTHLTPLCYTGE